MKLTRRPEFIGHYTYYYDVDGIIFLFNSKTSLLRFSYHNGDEIFRQSANMGHDSFYDLLKTIKQLKDV